MLLILIEAVTISKYISGAKTARFGILYDHPGYSSE
jgi:hypothetical protein